MELAQGKAHDLNHHKVGITSVYEAGGAKLVSLMVLDPTTRRETPHRLQVGDTFPVGDHTYKVAAINVPGSITIQKV